MHPANVVLAAVGTCQSVPGRTSLQKVCYFLAQVLGEGVTPPMHFRAHYYGPYSAMISEITENFVAAQLLEERVESRKMPSPSFTNAGVPLTEWRRYAYRLNEDGENAFGDLSRVEPAAVRAIEASAAKMIAETNLEPGPLSWAAKAHYLMHNEDVTEVDEMESTAKKMGWNLDRQQLERGVELSRIFLDNS